jgi:hypothetical protein
MQEPKYKTPNGQIVDKKELQSKYGTKFDELVKNKTFSEITEPVYKVPNGKYEVESVLTKKYGEKFNELKASFQTEANNDTKNLLNNQLGEAMLEITQRNLSL